RKVCEAWAIRSDNSSALSPPIGCLMTISRGLAPCAADCALTKGTKLSVTIRKFGMPRFSSSMESYRLHDEQAPQSAEARMAPLYFKTISFMMAAGAATPELLL